MLGSNYLKNITIDAENLLSPEERQTEIEIAKKFMNEMGIPIDSVDPDVYLRLFQFTRIASHREQYTQLELEQIQVARTNAIKLATLFGNFENAIEYVQRFYSRNSHIQQVVHDACLFSLPITSDWNVKIWRGLVEHHQPNGPNDSLMRLLPLADKIESYIKDNEKKIRDDILIEVKKNYIEQSTKEFEQKKMSQLSSDEWVSQQLKKKTKAIQNDFDNYIKQQLGLPLSSLTSDQLIIFRARIKNLTPEDHAIRNEIEEQYKQALLQRYAAEQLALSQSKEDYITKRLLEVDGKIQSASGSTELFSAKTPVATLVKYANTLTYRRAKENPAAAELFFAYNMPEHLFNLYLSLKPQDDPKEIPFHIIDGNKISSQYDGYYIKKLDPSDPRAALLGKFTSCCQSLGNDGEASTIHGITDPKGGFYVLCKKSGDHPSSTDEIVSQCWAWRGEDGNIVFDSIESQTDFIRKNTDMVEDFYLYLADVLVKQDNVPNVLVGRSGHTPKGLQFLNPFTFSKPVEYYKYRDSHEQSLLAKSDLPIFLLHNILNPKSAIPISSEPVDISIILQCFDHYAFGRDQQPPYEGFYKLGLNDQLQEDRFWLIQEWQELLKLRYDSNEKWELKVKELVKKGISVDLPSLDGKYRVLELAVKYGKWDLVEFLLAYKVNINANVDAKDPILILVATAGNWDLVKTLIDRGANLNINSTSLLRIACRQHGLEQDNLELVKYFIARGAEVNAKNKHGDTALLTAASQGKWETVKFLIEHNANINDTHARGYCQFSALAYAAMGNNLEMIEYLLDKGALVPDEFLLDLLEHGVKIETFRYFIEIKKLNIHPALLLEAAEQGNIELVQYLLDPRKVDINATTGNDENALNLAAQRNLWNVVEYLIDQGINVNNKNRDGGHVLHLAVSEGRTDIVQSLIEHSANVNATDKAGKTPLYFAILDNRIDIVKLLLDNGADMTIEAHDGKSMLALAENSPEIIECLQDQLNRKASSESKETTVSILEEHDSHPHQGNNISENAFKLIIKEADKYLKDRSGFFMVFRDRKLSLFKVSLVESFIENLNGLQFKNSGSIGNLLDVLELLDLSIEELSEEKNDAYENNELNSNDIKTLFSEIIKKWPSIQDLELDNKYDLFLTAIIYKLSEFLLRDEKEGYGKTYRPLFFSGLDYMVRNIDQIISEDYISEKKLSSRG